MTNFVELPKDVEVTIASKMPDALEMVHIGELSTLPDVSVYAVGSFHIMRDNYTQKVIMFDLKEIYQNVLEHLWDNT